MSHHVFVESNTTGTGRLAVELLLQDGARVTFVTSDAARYPFLAERHPRLRVVPCDTNDDAAIEACVRAIDREAAPGGGASQRGIDALLTFSTFYVTGVAAVARRLGLPTLDPEAARRCHHKHLGRACLARAGLATPAFWVVTSPAEAEAAARAVTYPCVVKPVADSGSVGVRRVDDRDALLAHYRALAARTVNERGQRLSGEVLIESLLVGPEFSIETLTLGGATRIIGITQKRLSAPPHFVELGHEFPAELDAQTRAAIATAVQDGLSAMGVDFGPAHTELRVTPDGPVIVEINPRLAGGMIPELVRQATGIDLLRAVLAMARGGEPELTATRDEVAGIRFFTAPSAGVLREVRGLDEVRGWPGVREARIDRRPGAVVRAPEAATDRLGHVIASGPDRARVLRDLEAALATVEIAVDDR